MNTLQKALRVNALFSGISGLTLILFNRQIADAFGVTNNTVFWVIGCLLIFFALTIWYEIKRQRKLAVIWIILQDFVWVLGSMFILIFNPFQLTAIGNTVIGSIALVVLFMGINQLLALRKTTLN